MNFLSWLRGWQSQKFNSSAKWPRQPARKAPRLVKPLLEELESRFAPATDSWITAAGGDWSNAASWSLGHAPASGDDVVVTGLNSGAVVTHSSGTDTIRILTLGGNLTLSGGSLTITTSATLQGGSTLTDGAVLNFTNAATVAFGNGTTHLVVGSGGVLTATNTAFSGNVNYSTQLIVNNGGQLSASGSTFVLNQVYLDNAATLNAVGDSFNCPLYLPASMVPGLSSSGSTQNTQFQDIDILAGSLASGQTLALNAIGVSTASLQYVFSGTFTLEGAQVGMAAAALNVGANVKVLVGANTTLTNNGTLTFATGDTVAFGNGTTHLVVGSGGVLTATNTAFSGNVNYSTQLIVNNGGQLSASGSTFVLNQVYLDNAATLNAVGDSFNCPLYLPASMVPGLSSSGSTQNTQFQDIDILAGSLASGQTLALNAIGVSTASLQYVFSGTFTLEGAQVGMAAAALNVGANVKVLVGANTTLTNNGTLTFATGDTVAFGNGTTHLVVGSGGVLTATNTAFSGNVNYSTQLIVNNGGQLSASGSTFVLNQVYLDNAATLNAVGDSFNCPLYLPASMVPGLSSSGSTQNTQFQDIDILAGSLASGQTLALNAIGVSTASLQYVFSGTFTLEGAQVGMAAAALNVGANVKVLVGANTTLTNNGTLTFATGDTVAFGNGTTHLVVGSGGVLTATNTAFSGNVNYSTQLIVNNGGQLSASGSTFVLNQVYLDNSSILNPGDLVGNSFNCPLFLPVTHVQYLSGPGNNNAQFQDIHILSGTVPGGQAVALNAIGTATTANLRYVLDSFITVASGGAMTVGANVNIYFPYAFPGYTVTVNGTLAFSPGAVANFYNSGADCGRQRRRHDRPRRDLHQRQPHRQ